MSIQFGQGSLGVIEAGSWRYEITWDDVLWAGRMITGEAGNENAASVEGAAVLWCMTSLLALRRGSSYTSLIQRYSQPINPKWRADGDFCVLGGTHPAFRNNPRPDGSRNYHGTDSCSPDRLARRDRIQGLSWEDLRGDVQDLVVRWARGQVQNPIPKAVEFAVPRVASRNRGVDGLRERNFNLIWDTLGRDESSTSGRGNAFYSNSRSERWNAEHVRIRFDQNIGTDSTLSSVEQETRPLGSGGSERREQGSGQQTELAAPLNDIFERTSAITSDRSEPPQHQFEYFQANGQFKDPSARNMLTEIQDKQLLKVNADRFFDQINALKKRSSLDMTQVVPILLILTEDDEGNPVNLNEKIFSVSPHDRRYTDEFEVFPDRPIASLESFEVTTQEPSVGGITGISMGTLNLKVHNPELVTRTHSIGKYIAYMMSQGFVMRIRYGIEGSYDSVSEEYRTAFQWKEEDFFVSQYNVTINNDKTMSLRVSVMPATQRLLNQVKIGQSLPVSELGNIKASDVESIAQQVVSGDSSASASQRQELQRRLSLFATQLNSATESPGVGLEARISGSFGFQLHAALTNRDIFDAGEDNIPAVPIPNMVEALQTVQGVMLTRRFQSILQKNCYRKTHRELSFNAVNVGPLVHEIIKPEIDYVFGVVSRNQIEIGEKFSVDEYPTSGDRVPRSSVKLIFGNFNSRAGQWANHPISSFPVNVETIFAHLRERRGVGEFSSTVNAFFSVINRMITERENYDPDTSQGAEEVRLQLEVPRIKYAIYPDPTDRASWVMYIYDSKIPTVRVREAIDTLANESRDRRPPTKDEVIRMLEQNKIPYIEMGEEGSFIKQFSGETQSDDLLASHNMIMANRSSRTVREFDNAISWPAGISREFAASTHMTPQQIIRSVSYVAPIRVSVQSFVLPTAYFAGPIFIFFPVRTFSGIYLIHEIRHDIKQQGALTNMSLQINLSVYNQIAL